jgi:hypothetical protein
MRSILKYGMICILSLITFTLFACSGGQKSPIEPSQNGMPVVSDNLTDQQESSRSILAVYDAVIDPVAKTFVVTPDTRSLDYHMALTNYFPNVLQIINYGVDPPYFWAEISLTHPLLGSGKSVYDPRIIAILPANPSVSCNYPFLNVQANNSVVINPDGYTKLFDNIETSMPGNTNPFMAYFKSSPYREWSSTGGTSDMQLWTMNLDGFGGPMHFKLVVDVSTNYPNPPHIIVDNAQEPVQINATIRPGLTYEGGMASAEITILDWQGVSGTIVGVECPDLFNNVVLFNYTSPGPNPDEYVFSGEIGNPLLAPAGEYKILLAALDQATGTLIYNETSVIVENIPDNPVDVSPPGLGCEGKDVFVEGNYAYVASGAAGLKIFDITIPESSFLVKTVATPYAEGVFVIYGNAFVACETAGLVIIDVDPVGSASIIKTVDTPGSAYGVYVDGDRAYVADYDAGLQIIDILPASDAHIIATVDTPGRSKGVCVADGYCYIADEEYIQVVDIYPFMDIALVQTLDAVGDAEDVCVSEGYLYVADGRNLDIIDIKVPESAFIVNTIPALYYVQDVQVQGGYSYLPIYNQGMEIMDVIPCDEAYSLTSISTPQYAYAVDLQGQYAYLADKSAGLRVIKLW